MGERVSVIFVIEAAADPAKDADHRLHAVASAFLDRRLEATFLLSRGRAEQITREDTAELRPLLKRQDIGFIAGGGAGAPPPAAYIGDLDWAQGVAAFQKAELPAYKGVAFLAGRIPSTCGLESWAPQAFGALEPWGIRVVISRHAFLANDGEPFFYGGRLNLSELGKHWIEATGPLLRPGGEEAIFKRFEGLFVRDAVRGGIACVRINAAEIPHEAESFFRSLGSLLDRLVECGGAWVESARQAADRYADISYEHRITLEDLLSIAEHASRPEIRPYAYRAGYLSAAEQLYLLAAAWDETRRKGKLVRNSTTRTPLGPSEFAVTDPQVKGIPSERVTSLVGELFKYLTDHGRLPARLDLGDGGIAIQDLLPTLAAGFHDSLSQVGLGLRRGNLFQPERVREDLARLVWQEPGHPPEFAAPRQIELARLQLWTFKPVLGIAFD